MASHDQQLRNPRYRDWVKAGLALKYLKDGIEKFVDDETKEQQKNILHEVQKEIGRPGATCNSCPIDQLLAYKRGRYKKGNFCSYDVCDRLFDKIVEQHMYGRPSWSNTDSTKWCTDHWEIAKCFLDGGGYGDKVSAADTDCKGLLSVITNNMFVQRHVDTPIDRLEPKTDVFSKSKEARNEILHLASLQLPVETLNGYIDAMIQLLEDKGKLHEHKNAEQSILKLRRLKETDLFISTEDEWETREAALKAVQERKQDALDVIEKKQNDVLEKLQIDKIQETLEELSKTSKEISNSFANRYELLEQRQNMLERTLKNYQTEMSKTVKELQKDVANLKKDVSDLKARFDAFDEVELQHKKRISYLDHKKVVRKELISMYSKYLKIPVPPLLKHFDATVEEFYMELEICDDPVYEKRNKKEIKEFSCVFLSGSQHRMSYRYFANYVRNYHELFYKTGVKVENIYVLGDAGVGKTTWCLKLIDIWLQGLKKQEKESMHILSPNDKMMLELDIVLFVSLKHASNDVNLIDMIRKQIFDQTPQLFEYMQEVINIEPEKCLVIADGLDEWNAPDDQIATALDNNPSFPSRKNMNHCTVLTTTRSWKLNEAQPSCSQIDRAVMIKGLNGSECVCALAEKVINKLNQNVSCVTTSSKLRNKKKVADFEHELHKRFNSGRFRYNDSVTKNPFILIHMIVKWYNDGSLESTMAGNYSFMLKSLFEHEEGYRNIKPKYGRKQKLDGRLSCVPYIEEAKLEWSTDADKLPECVRKHAVCRQYSGLILKLAGIAFEGLFDRNNKALIFSEESLLEKLSPEEIEVAVKSGILSKSDIVGFCNVSKLSFLHKTVQEFLAAIHIVAYHEDERRSCFQNFKKYCSNSDRTNEMENVTLFSCGLDANLATKILKHVCNVENHGIKNNFKLNAFRHNNSLLLLLSKCFKELREVSSVASIPMVHLISFVASAKTQDFDDLLDLLETNVDKGNVKFVEANMVGQEPDRFLDILTSEMFPLSNLTTLQLENLSEYFKYTGKHRRVVFNLPCLRILRLYFINTIDLGNKGVRHFVLDFSHSKDLDSVDLESIFACQIILRGKNLTHFDVHYLTPYHINISNDAAITAVENEQTIYGDKNCISLTQRASQTRIRIYIKNCTMSKIGINFAGGNEKTNGMIAQIASLTCEQSM